jgi:hypothetical protein
MSSGGKFPESFRASDSQSQTNGNAPARVNGVEIGEMMHIAKIISGGQTGAGRAALDAAIELGIDHGGWVPKGRLAEDGPLSEKYNLTEMPTASYPARTERNVTGSDGTVIFSHGPLRGGSALTAELAHRHGKPCLHIDLNRMLPLKASSDIHRWIVAKGVRTLNVAGPGPSNDPGIYNHTYRAMWGLFALDAMDGQPASDINPFRLNAPAREMLIWPETLEELVEFLEDGLPFGHRFNISRMNEKQLADIHARLGGWIQETFGLWRGNEKLLQSAEGWTFRKTTSPEDASWVVIRALASRLRRTQWLR